MTTALRQHAEERLKNGTAPVTGSWPTGAEALSLLYKLASAPQSASEALKLLHELQVHQVELDLQHEQAELNASQLTADLARAAVLFELAPCAYLVLDTAGHVIAANRLAAAWLGFAAGPGAGEACVGSRIETLLAADSRAPMRDLLGALRRGMQKDIGQNIGQVTGQNIGQNIGQIAGRSTDQPTAAHRCTVQSKASGAAAQMVATATPDGGQVLLAFMPAEPAAGH